MYGNLQHKNIFYVGIEGAYAFYRRRGEKDVGVFMKAVV